jgi:hypothetical protein
MPDKDYTTMQPEELQAELKEIPDEEILDLIKNQAQDPADEEGE